MSLTLTHSLSYEMSVCLLFVCLSLTRGVCLYICLSTCVSICLSVICVAACCPSLSVCLSVCLILCLSADLPVCLHVCLSLCFCLSVWWFVCFCLPSHPSLKNKLKKGGNKMRLFTWRCLMVLFTSKDFTYNHSHSY